ncbi:MAG: transglutaminase-like domain-containing protein [Candidatus Marinimicrobia bacterium]|nr:transglutaminase-like domain-containing protein [Candidatus Neomarinimicrobiota bacterium]MCF7921099.1 transglutaminase-like domain-containing protein [Candidatus Neomarinimicrobiota bacterium]
MIEDSIDMKEQINQAIRKGEFTEATQLITHYLDDGSLSEQDRRVYTFEMERLSRVRADFTQTQAEVENYIKKYYPEMTAADMESWEAEKSLEFKIIDGQKRYFARAARNLFRIDAEMEKIWIAQHPEDEISSGSGAKLVLDVHNAQVIKAANSSQQLFVEPRRLRIKQSIEVLADEVPAGEIVKCWIPYPRLIEGRQENIDLIQTVPAEHQLAAPDALQRTIYMEKPALAGESTKFSVEYEFNSHGVYQAIDADLVTPLKDSLSLNQYLQEEAPHIVFTEGLRALSREIVGDEQNPYQIAQLLFAWVDENTPWASASEYSTIPCIPEYALENHHGDCGIQTLFFITLCRINGIPARWQSGWELQPPDDSMHDWGMIYFEPYGWVPMDVTYGLRKSSDPQLRWFYLSGMDSYRIIFNDDISQPFSPPKQHFRSETVDSQRGEVEWSGGNLYFDKWKWNFEWKIIE